MTLRDLHGLTYDEIAQILDSPESTVKSRINRARQALRNILSSKTELYSMNTSNNVKGGLEMMNCADVRENISAYADNELSVNERKAFEEHISSCAGCKKRA